MGIHFNNMAVIACLKILLGVFNFVFSLTGVLMLILGFWVELDLRNYMDLAPELSGSASHVILGNAVLIMVMSSVAFTCINNDLHRLLYIYGGFLITIFMMEVGVGVAVFCYRDTFARGLHDGLTTAITSYEPPGSINFAQSMLQCCGVSNYTDWMRLSPHRVIPISCCQDKTRCVTANYSDVYQRGCYEVITLYFLNNLNTLLGLAVGITILPLLGAVLSCSLGILIENTKTDIIND